MVDDVAVPEVPAKIKPGNIEAASNYPVKLVARAYELFLNSEMGFMEIAMELQVPRVEIARWSKEGNWIERKKAIEKELMYEAESRFRDFRIKNKLVEAKNQLELGKQGEDVIRMLIEELKKQLSSGKKVSPIHMKQLMDALSAASGVAARAIGLSEQPDEASAVKQAPPARLPIILIGPGTEPRVPVEVRAIDVEVERKELANETSG